MNKATVRDFVTGATAIAGLSALAIMLILFGETKNIFNKTYEFDLRLPAAGGMREGAPVTLNGVRIGQVRKATILEAPQRGVDLRLRINDGVKIPRAVSVAIDKSFVGEAVLDFAIPDGAGAADLATLIKPDEVVSDKQVTSLFGQLTDMVEEPLRKLSKAADKIDALASTYNDAGVEIKTVAKRLNDMLEPRTLADVAAGKPANVASTMARVDAALTSADKWLGDEQLRADAKLIVQKGQRVMDDASTLVKSWTATGESVQKTVDQSAAKIDAALSSIQSTASKADKAADEFAKLLEGINQGKGTAGQLATNPDLYNSLKDAATRLDRALTEFQALMEKVKAEGIRVGL